jgi:hypothetical protein
MQRLIGRLAKPNGQRLRGHWLRQLRDCGKRQKEEGGRRKAAMPFLFLALSLWVEFSVEFQYSKGVFRA